MESFSYILYGDVGGTNARLELKKVLKEDLTKREVVKADKLPSQDYKTFDDVIETFLKGFKEQNIWPKVCVIGVAGPVNNNSIKFTNLEWPLISGADLETKFGFKVLLLNDFVANGYGVLNLSEEDYVRLSSADVVEGAPKALIGAGTGLGQGYLTKGITSEAYDVWGSEGGHVDYAPRNQLEFDLLNFTKEKLGISRVSVERVCAGPAIPLIYELLRNKEPELERVLEKGGKKPEQLDPSEITNAALKDHDPLCKKVIDFFIAIFGAEAGNLAVKVVPKGGLYLLGGATISMMDYMISTNIFLDNFYDKGRMKPLLEQIPIFLVKHTAGVQGAEEFAIRHI